MKKTPWLALSLGCAVTLALLATTVARAADVATHAITYYFSTSGADENDGLSMTTPKRSLSLVPSLMRPGVTVLLKRGDAWSETALRWDLSGRGREDSAPMRIGSYGDASLARPRITISDAGGGPLIVAKDTRHLVVEGLDLRGPANWRAARLEGTTRDVRLDDVRVREARTRVAQGAELDGGGNEGGGNPAIRKYYCSSSSGSDSNNGESPETAVRTLQKVMPLLGPGVEVLLKRGDSWSDEPWRNYLDLSNLRGTEAFPVKLGAYGDPALPRPVVSNLVRIVASTAQNAPLTTTRWTRFDVSGYQEYRARQHAHTYFSDPAHRPAGFNFNLTYRVYIAGVPISRVPAWNLHYAVGPHYTVVNDPAESYIALNQAAYDLVQAAGYADALEAMSSGPILKCSNTSHLTISEIEFRGGDTGTAMFFKAPNDHITIENCTLRQFWMYGITWEGPTDAQGHDLWSLETINQDIQMTGITIDKGWAEDMNSEEITSIVVDDPCDFFHPYRGSNGYCVTVCPAGFSGAVGICPVPLAPPIEEPGELPHGGFSIEAPHVRGGTGDYEPGGDGILIRNAARGVVIRGCAITNMGHSGIGNEVGIRTGSTIGGENIHGTHEILIEGNDISAGTSSYMRALNLVGAAEHCSDVVVRRNYFHDLTQASQVGGGRLSIYSNVFDGLHLSDVVSGKISPYGLVAFTPDAIQGYRGVLINSVIANNVFRGMGAVLNLPHNKEPLGLVDGLVFANNLLLDWYRVDWEHMEAVSYEEGPNHFQLLCKACFNPKATGIPLQIDSFWESNQAVTLQNNGFWGGTPNSYVHATFDTSKLGVHLDSTFVAGLNAKAGFAAGNLEAQPSFTSGVGALAFRPAPQSPYVCGGVPLASLLPVGVDAVDFEGNAFDSDSPSIGAFQRSPAGAQLTTSSGVPVADGSLVVDEDVEILAPPAHTIEVTRSGVPVSIPACRSWLTSDGVYAVTENNAHYISFTIDKLAPLAPAFTVSNDTIWTKVTPRAIGGTAEGSSTVTVTRTGGSGTVILTNVAASNGTFSANSSSMTNGVTYNFTAVAQDAAGHVSPISTWSRMTMDTSAPVISGPRNGRSYFGSCPVISWNEYGCTALLNGEPIEKGHQITTSANYQLSVTDRAGNNSTINFTVQF